MSGAVQAQNTTGGFDFAQLDVSKNLKTADANGAATKATLAPVATPIAIARTSLTTAAAIASLACVRGFWISNPGTVRIYYALASGTAPAADGSNSTGFIEPGDRKWFGYANANLLQVVSSSGTAQYCVDGE